MKRLLEAAFRRGRQEEFAIDPNIPASYLAGYLFVKLIAMVRGAFCFGVKGKGVLLLGRRTQIRHARGITIEGVTSIGDDCVLDALSSDGIRFSSGVSLGDRVVVKCTGSFRSLGKGVSFGPHVGIGDSCFLGCAGGISIGGDTILGNFVSLHSENHVFSDLKTAIRLQGVTHQGIVIGENCWLGAKVTLLDGVRLGSGSIVAAGAVVTAGEYPENSILGGVPARIIRMRDEP